MTTSVRMAANAGSGAMPPVVIPARTSSDAAARVVARKWVSRGLQPVFVVEAHALLRERPASGRVAWVDPTDSDHLWYLPVMDG